MLLEILKYVGLFLIFFTVTYLVYYFLVTNGQIKSIRGKSKKKKELSSELLILRDRYHVNIEKVGIIKILRIVNFINALLISGLVMAVLPIKQTWLKLIVILVVLIPLVLIVYSLLAKYLKYLERKNDNV